MLNELVKHQSELLKMAKRFDSQNADDLLQDTYIRLYDTGKDFKDIDLSYIYSVMRSIFIDKHRRVKEIPFEDFSDFQLETETEYKEADPINLDVLSNVEKQIYYSYFGRNITNDKNEIIAQIEGVNLSKLSRETGISYRTIYTRFQRLKEKICLEMQSKQ